MSEFDKHRLYTFGVSDDFCANQHNHTHSNNKHTQRTHNNVTMLSPNSHRSLFDNAACSVCVKRVKTSYRSVVMEEEMKTTQTTLR